MHFYLFIWNYAIVAFLALIRCLWINLRYMRAVPLEPRVTSLKHIPLLKHLFRGVTTWNGKILSRLTRKRNRWIFFIIFVSRIKMLINFSSYYFKRVFLRMTSTRIAIVWISVIMRLHNTRGTGRTEETDKKIHNNLFWCASSAFSHSNG